MPFDFDAVVAPFRMQPGLRRLADGARVLHPLAPDSPVLAEKLAVLAQDAPHALCTAEGFDALPAWRHLAAEAALQNPGLIAWDGERFASRPLGLQVDKAGGLGPAAGSPCPAATAVVAALPASQRLAAALALALHEDFAVVDAASTRLGATAVCLPSHWDPAHKVGLPFAAVHAPVADNATLVAAGAHLMKLVCGPQRWERFVWTVTPHRLHDQHPLRHGRSAWPSSAAPASPDAVAEAAMFRTEHQSFLPMPERGQAVFTIQVEVRPLATALADAAQARQLHDAIASMSDNVLAYRGLGPAREGLLAWLARRATA